MNLSTRKDRSYKKELLLVFITTITLLQFFLPGGAAKGSTATMTDYIGLPPFLTVQVDPNVLLVLDNSGSMNELAYHEVKGCRTTYENTTQASAWTGYNPGTEYYGLFDPNMCYRYDNTNHYFYEDEATEDDASTADITERSTGSNPDVKKFSGNWLNWWTMRRFDVAKKVLTGGRIAPDITDTVLEGMPTDGRDLRRIFYDEINANDPIAGKNVYYTPFHQGIYSYFFNIDRNDFLGGAPNKFAIMFNVVTATFDAATDLIATDDLTGNTCVDVPYTDLTRPADPADNGDNTGETGYLYDGYVVAVKVEPADLPVEGIIQKMSDRVRFGYMQFNYGTGPGEGCATNGLVRAWDINGDDSDDIIWRYADGGRVRNYIGDTATITDPHGDNVLQIIQNINQQNIQMNTPLEEVLWEATRYYQQVAPEFSPESAPDTPPSNSVDYEENNTWDPFYFNDLATFVPCVKSNIIFLSDGEGNNNSGRPTAFWPAGAKTNKLTGNGSGYLDDIAFNMHTQDLRDDVAMGETSELVDQTITLYTVFCFDDSNNARCEMMKAARAGGFIDRNGDGDTGGTISDTDPAAFEGDLEWDENGDNVPDTYFDAQNGAEMEEKIMKAIIDILKRSSSGTAASVISNSRAGEGAIYQAVFFPSLIDGNGNEVTWIGDVHSLWIDQYGNIREDCGDADSCGAPCGSSCTGDRILDLDTDYIIEFYTDDLGSARVKRFRDTHGNGEYNDPEDYDETTDALCVNALSGSTEEALCTAALGGDDLDMVETNIPLQDIRYLWDAGSWLSDASHTQKTSYSDTTDKRYIFTWTPGPDADPIPFTPTYIKAADANYFRFFGAANEGEANKIINYIRGDDQADSTDFRSRQIDCDGDSIPETYKLGDIIHSTPTIVSAPAEGYDVIYADPTYQTFRKKYERRRVMIYAGANDGGLHAFNGGYYDRQKKQFFNAPRSPTDIVEGAKYDLGAEMWMFIPFNLIPHLRWLTDPAYGGANHVYYVDLKPRIFDAKIFDSNDGVHLGGWGTILVGGMRFGGGEIGVDSNGDGSDDMTMRSAYFILDITNPECPPVILAEFTDEKLGFTTSYPTAIPMVTCDFKGRTDSTTDDCLDPNNPSMDWYLAFGSGPHVTGNPQEAIKGVSDQKALMYVMKLGSSSSPVYTTSSGDCAAVSTYNRPVGTDVFTFEATENNSFFSDVVTVDYDLSYQADAIYAGLIYNAVAAGSKADLEAHKGAMYRLTIDDEYLDPSTNWDLDTLIDVGRPVTAAPAVAYDGSQFWVYFGTGRLLTDKDKLTNIRESYYGIKETVKVDGDLKWPKYGSIPTAANPTPNPTPNLMNVTNVEVTETTGALSSTVGVNATNSFAKLWSSEISLYDGWMFNLPSGERNIGQASILGDIVAFTTYEPSLDICAAEGESYLYAVYYLTGTAYYKSVIGVEGTTVCRRRRLGRGLATTPNIHTGVEDTAKSFVQTSTGAVLKIEQDNPGIIKSGPSSWRELSGNN